MLVCRRCFLWCSGVCHLSRPSANQFGGLQRGGFPWLSLAVCPSAACSSPYGAKVPHAIAVAASCPAAVSTTPSARQGCSGHRKVDRRPLAVVCGLAFSNRWLRTWTSARIKCQTSSPPVVGLQVVAFWPGACASGRISAIQAKGARTCQGQTSVITAKSACSHQLFLLATA